MIHNPVRARSGITDWFICGSRSPGRAGLLAFLYLLVTPLLRALPIGEGRYVDFAYHPGDFGVVMRNAATTLFVDSADYPGVTRAVGDLQADIERVTNRSAVIARDIKSSGSNVIIVGTVGKSKVIDQLIRDRKIDVAAIAGKWESFLIQVVPKPLPGVATALVIAGSDKRGTIFAVYDLSDQIGVSPWYWWADVPVQHHDELFVKPGSHVQGPPAVKYRGIFLNDEAPSLTGWVHEKFGNYNHEFYTNIFELLLRLKANYLWPAMWNNAFNEDDPLNPQLADEYGIVMGTSHHEPMLRAQQEWKRHGKGPWDYSKNSEVLKELWAQGVERNKEFESIITLGMRGDGDLPMSESANIALLEKIVADQRKIIADRVNPDLSKVQQDWALYKEVQEYYEKGMRVPDDVTLLWCDDNWGNIRRLPTPEERKRSGGAGVYYHFDYVGDPRSYKWLNTIPIAKVWEQMNLAYHYGTDRIWIVNVGDLKPMELPIDFFLNMAWRPENWPKEKISEFTRLWAERQFGPEFAPEIADILAKYTKYNSRRKPELLEPDTFSLVDYLEADTVFADFHAAAAKAEEINAKLPENQRDAFFELVLYPTKASAIVTELYITAGRNQLYATQGRASTNDLAAEARALFKADADLSAYYNHTLAHGKWDHMMDQTHIGYTYWNQPLVNAMPKVTEIELQAPAQLGVATEGSALSWPGSPGEATLPPFDSFNQQRRYIDIFNRGREPFLFSATSSVPWIVLSESQGTIEKQRRVWVSVDWDKAPVGRASGSLKIQGGGAQEVAVNVNAFRPRELTRESLNGFVESDGYVSIEAAHYNKKVDGPSSRWEKIDDLGRTLSSMSVFPVTAESVTPPRDSPRLEYEMYLFDPRTVEVEAILAPTLNFVPGRGLRYAVSFDDETPQIIDALAQNSVKDWGTSVKDSVRKVQSTHLLAKSGYHTLKFWMVDPGVVLQKLVVNLGGVKPSYLGPPESYHRVEPEPAAEYAAYKDTRLSTEQRVNNLVSHMTLEEKVSQIGHTADAVPRLGIPEYNWWNEGLHGVARAGYATVFPQSIGLAATFDEPLIHQIADVISTEFRAKYYAELRQDGSSAWYRGLTIWSPNINIFRDPRWGRGQETYGEDPYLTSRLGVAFVTGLQGSDTRYLKTVATAKHFAVHSGPESTRHSVDVQASRHDMEDTYLPAFRAAVMEGKTQSVMCAYNAVNGQPACANTPLLQEHLRRDWSFQGYVVSDCGAVTDIPDHHQFTKSLEEGVTAVLHAGTDLICGDPRSRVQREREAVLKAVQQDLLPEADLDRALGRLFTARFRLGMFDPSSMVSYSQISPAENDTEAHRQLALRTARESIVLLKNKNNFLPLKQAPATIAVIGPDADSLDAIVGNYNGVPSQPVTVLAGVRSRFSQSKIVYVEGSGLVGPVTKAVLPDALYTDDSRKQHGLKGEYFSNVSLEGAPVMSRIDPTVDFAWGDTGILPELQKNYSVRWTGALIPPETGEYLVGFTGQDGYRLWFAGDLIAQDWNVHHPPTTQIKKFHLDKDQAYPIKIEYFETIRSAEARFVWSLPEHETQEAIDATRNADLAIMVLGLSPRIEGEEMKVDAAGFAGGDRTNIALPVPQEQLLEQIYATGKPVVLVLMNGSALAVNWADEHLPAIIEAWYPGGQGGTAVAEALAGDFSPAGRLPVTFYKSTEQLPPFEDYSMTKRTYRYFSGAPLYPFGYGLSYASFKYRNPLVDNPNVSASGTATVSVDVANTGAMTGDEVVQLYLTHSGIAGAPLRALKGFQRVHLERNQRKNVSFTLRARDLSVVDETGRHRIVPGRVEVWIGGGQPTAPSGRIKVAGTHVHFTITDEATLPD